MSKYGANGADDALGICLHDLIVSAAVRSYRVGKEDKVNQVEYY